MPNLPTTMPPAAASPNRQATSPGPTGRVRAAIPAVSAASAVASLTSDSSSSRPVSRRGIPIRHGRRLSSLAEGAAGVSAAFTDGSTVDAEVVIGADGLNSTVRQLIDPAATRRRFAGQRVFYGYSTGIDGPPIAGRITMIRGSGTAFGYTVSPAGEAYWFARVTDDELPAAALSATAPAAWREWLVARLRADPTPASDIVAAADDRLRVTNAYDLPDVPRWRTGRTMLIGDAAHAAAPATGQGASMALEDAIVLAKAVRDADSLDTAFKWYERLRRPRVSANISASAGMTAGQAPADRGSDHAHRLDWARQLDWNSVLTG